MPAIILGVGSAIASGVSSIFGSKANSAAAALRNQQAQQQWIQRNTQKTINNSRQQFQAVQATIQQAKRNAAIAASAYQNQFNRQNNLSDQINYQKTEMAVDSQIARAALVNIAAAKGLGQKNGTQNAILRAQMLNMLSNNNQLRRNYEIQKQDIQNQFKSEMSQMTEQVFMPNLELYDAAPIYEDTGYSALPGLLQIGAGIAGGVAGMAGGAGTSGPDTRSMYNDRAGLGGYGDGSGFRGNGRPD